VRVYSRALSAQEVQNLYAQGVANAAHSNSSAGSGQATAPLSNGLVGYWTMDGSAINWATGKMTDTSGQGNTGSLVSMSTTTSPVTGKIGQALQFNGSNSYISASASASLNNMSAITISAWIKPTAVNGTTPPRILAKRTNGGTGWWDFGVDGSSTLFFDVNYSSTNLARNSATTVPLNKWTHVVVAWTGSSSASSIKLYINGAEVSYGATTDGAGSRLSDSAYDVVVGNWKSADRPFNGTLDDVRVYNRALSASEVQQLYNLGK
jgi:hypothetical protein